MSKITDQQQVVDSYLSIIELLFERNWYRLAEQFIHITGSLTDGCVLSFLIGWAHKVNKKNKLKQPIIQWFYCKSSTMERRLLLTQRQQLPILTRLREKKFIEMTRSGNPLRRYVRINLVEIGRAVANQVPE